MNCTAQNLSIFANKQKASYKAVLSGPTSWRVVFLVFVYGKVDLGARTELMKY